jgi:hypothetical protein
MSWSTFETAAPELAVTGRQALERDGRPQGLLATVRGGDPPRIHPISLGIVDGRLLTFILKSAKRADLEHDGRYALHAHLDPDVPIEFMVRGRARRVDEREGRERLRPLRGSERGHRNRHSERRAREDRERRRRRVAGDEA